MLALLAEDPLSAAHSKQLIGLAGLRSARAGNWRILFLVGDEVVNVVRVGHRREVYNNL
jgi:mRNA-degrading endonuclease RelE of RelBE toxin-antitoxin system